MTREWRERLLWLTIAAAIVAGSWLLALAFDAGDPPPSYGALPTSTRYSVTPVMSSGTASATPRASTAFAPIATPPAALVNDPCTNWRTAAPPVLRHPRCPTMVSAAGWMGR